VQYRVYGREMSVRTNWVESSFAMLNGAPTFITLVEPSPVARPHELVVDLPPDWRGVATALDPLPGVERGFVAADFDTLVDSPILAGSPAVHAFDVDGIPHALVNIGDDRLWDGARAAADVEKIVRATRDLWGRLPYPRYLFLNVIAEAGGGLEHRDSTLIMSSRWTMRTPRRYQGWLGLVAHEFFHAWNVKRLRPAALGPFDYEREVYTTDLWIAEGLTSYYDDLLVLRAGLSTRDEYLAALSNQIQALQTTPGRLVQPVAGASYDAWIRHYRPDENSPNVAVSYYTKGAVVGFLLDMRVREATRGANARRRDASRVRTFSRAIAATPTPSSAARRARSPGSTSRRGSRGRSTRPRNSTTSPPSRGSDCASAPRARPGPTAGGSARRPGPTGAASSCRRCGAARRPTTPA
jgi:predicted metalloprotease with PDZ domain